MLNEMVLCEELFHTPSGVAFADFITEGHRETWPIRSKRFRTWLRRCYYHATGSAPSAAAIRSALDLLEARAQFDGPERAVNTRVAEHAGRLYLDLADEHWRAVAIGPDGWRVLGCPPVRFRRAPGMLPLPVPERGGSIEALQSFLNLSNQNEFVLVVAWLLAALRSSGPYPLLAISGEQGSAKTVLSKLLSLTVSQISVSVPSGAAWATRERRGESGHQSPSHRCNRVRNVAFRPQRRILWAGNLRVRQIAGRAWWHDLLRGESSLARRSGIRMPQCKGWRDGGSRATPVLQNVPARPPA